MTVAYPVFRLRNGFIEICSSPKSPWIEVEDAVSQGVLSSEEGNKLKETWKTPRYS